MRLVAAVAIAFCAFVSFADSAQYPITGYVDVPAGGTPGPQGPAGPAGPQGATGPQGPAGSGDSGDITCGAADDTPAAQAALNATGILSLPAGICRISSLNATNSGGIVIKGKGLRTQIYPTQSGANVIDLTGASHATLRDFRLCGYCTPGIIPNTGILNAQVAEHFGSDVTQITNVRVDGHFEKAAWFNLSVQSAGAQFSQFYNYQPNRQTIVFTGNITGWGVTSQFANIRTANDAVPSDWTLQQVECHNFGNSNCLWIGGAISLRIYGGNISSSGIPVSINAVVISGVTAYPAFLIFDGTTFYNDFAPTPSCAVQNNAGAPGAPSFRANQISMATLSC